MKRYQKKLFISLVTLLMGAAVSAFTSYKDQLSSSQTYKTNAVQISISPQVAGITSQSAKVIQVIDGDTFKIEGGEKVRMIGMDTPEIHHPTKPVQCFGKEAMQKTKELIEGKEVKLEKDVSERDRYGRLLRFVYLEPSPSASPSGELFINEYLVKEGFAHAATFPPDVSKAELFRNDEREARYNQKGLWKNCPM